MTESYANDREFTKLRAGRDDVDLIGAMLELDRELHPGLDEQAVRDELQRLADRVVDALEIEPHAGVLYRQLEIVSRVLHREHGLCGDLDNYYDPRNSYLHEVLARRRGIPITLSIVYQAVANLAGLPVYGVATPGHFVLGCESNDELWYIDPFALGQVLSFEECRRRIEKNLGQSNVLDISHFQGASPLEIMLRVMRNLKTALAGQNGWSQLLLVQRRLAWLLNDEPSEVRDLGLIYLRLGDARQAVRCLQLFNDQCADDDARQAIAPYLKSARRMFAELN